MKLIEIWRFIAGDAVWPPSGLLLTLASIVLLKHNGASSATLAPVLPLGIALGLVAGFFEKT